MRKVKLRLQSMRKTGGKYGNDPAGLARPGPYSALTGYSRDEYDVAKYLTETRDRRSHNTCSFLSAFHQRPALFFFLDLSPALPKWEGSLLDDGFTDFPTQRYLTLGFSPLGEEGEGFSQAT